MLNNCSTVKAILLLIVIFGHSIAYWASDWFTGDSTFRPTLLHVLLDWIGSFHVYGFALVSGYIFAYKIESGGYKVFLEFVLKKAKRLIVPYMFVAMIWVIPISILFLPWNVEYIIRNFILCEGPSQLWFLWMLFDVFVIVRLLWKLISKNHFLGWSISLILYGIGIVGYKYIPNYFNIWIALQYVIVFYVGIIIWQGSKLSKVPWYLWLIMDIVLYWLLKSCSHIHYTYISILSIGLSLLLHLVGAMMIFGFLQNILYNYSLRNHKIVNSFCETSLSIYLFHQQIIYLCIVLLKDLVPVYINIIINIFVSIIVSYAIGRFLMKFRVTRFLVGETLK